MPTLDPSLRATGCAIPVPPAQTPKHGSTLGLKITEIQGISSLAWILNLKLQNFAPRGLTAIRTNRSTQNGQSQDEASKIKQNFNKFHSCTGFFISRSLAVDSVR